MTVSYDDAAHLLRRAGFGGTADEIGALTGLDLPAAVARVLDVSPNPPSSPPAVIYDEAAPWWDRYVAMVEFWTERMRTVPRPVAEKMTLFWHGHFCSGIDKVDKHGLLMDQNQTFRSMGMGSFAALTKAVSRGPAMLVYLDNAESEKDSPNENFARELMELFTMGVGHYSQEDVRASAAAWTGHGLDPSGMHYEFHPLDHDASTKTFFGKAANWDGPQIIDEIVSGAGQSACARFIAAKLWSFFAYPNPDTVLVATLAGAFIGAGMDVTALLRAIFGHPEFYSQRAKQALVRSPADLIVSAMRATGLDSAKVHPEWWLGGMGQELFNPPNVAGWHGNASWLSTSGMWRRQAFARHVCWAATDAGLLANSDTLSVPAAVGRAFDTFGIHNPTLMTRSALEAAVTAERSAKGWAERQNLITLAIVSPEFNLS